MADVNMHDERYTKVNPEKMLDAADKLEKTVDEIGYVLDYMWSKVEQVEGQEPQSEGELRQANISTIWWGEARDKWYAEFYSAYNDLYDDIEKYRQFCKYIRVWAERYLRAAAHAEIKGNETGEHVRELLKDMLYAYDLPSDGSVTLGSIYGAHKERPALISGIHFDVPGEGTDKNKAAAPTDTPAENAE